MTLYLVAGVGASTDPVPLQAHLPSARASRYPSDMTDAEWMVVAPLVPAGGSGPRGGRPLIHSRRDIVDAIRFAAHNGGAWRALPADFPPWKTVYDYHAQWAADGTVNRVHNALREQVRLAEGRRPEPSAALVDSRSVRAAETVARTSRGFNGGKKVNGRKRHIATDTTGLLLVVLVTAASVRNVVPDHPMPANRPRLRTSARPPRHLRPMVHDHRHDPAAGPPPDSIPTPTRSRQASIQH